MMLFFYNLIVYYNVFLTKPLPDFFSEMEKINPFLCNIDKNTVNYFIFYSNRFSLLQILSYEII